MGMIRLELLEPHGTTLYTVGLFVVVEDDYFIMTHLDTRPRLENPRAIYFPTWKGDKRELSHIGIFPLLEHTGVVARLTVPMRMDKDAVASFAPGSITLDMIIGDQPTTVVKGH
jgi:hypothetical protein